VVLDEIVGLAENESGCSSDAQYLAAGVNMIDAMWVQQEIAGLISPLASLNQVQP
jgi:hypothetical protein